MASATLQTQPVNMQFAAPSLRCISSFDSLLLSRALIISKQYFTGARPVVYQVVPLCTEHQSLVEKNFRVVMDDKVDLYSHEVSAVLVNFLPNVTSSFLQKFPNLRVIGNNGVGYDNIDLQACKSLGIRVGYTPNVLNETTADMAVALLLSAARRVVEGDRMCKDPSFTTLETGWFGNQVSGTTAGIVGMGRIGLEIAKRLRGFNIKILYYNRNRRAAETERQVNAEYIPDLYSMLSQCDHVVLAAPATPTTYRMFGEKEFSSMKDNSIFVNISRGSLVNQDALVKALSEGSIRAAGLDVTDPEPLPRDHPLLGFPNVTITPHVAWATVETSLKMTQLTIDNIWGGLNNTVMPNEIVL